MTKTKENLLVIIRARPLNKRERSLSSKCIVEFINENSLIFDPESKSEFSFQCQQEKLRTHFKQPTHKNFALTFDRIYEPDTTNEEIFGENVQSLLDSFMKGYNTTIFAYGATGAGKTYTMCGDGNALGLIQLAVQYLFARMEQQSTKRRFEVGVSYIEIYNEQVMNLLATAQPLKLMENHNGVVVNGLALTPIHSMEQLQDLLDIGNANRTQHPTVANAQSSRSHAVFQMYLQITDRNSELRRSVKLSMIDLAGSERAATAQNKGMRFKEGACINRSLLALGNCINKLAEGNKHIPYRDSNLTRMLKDSLGGNCRTLMIANIAISSRSFDDTYSTLRYAIRAKKIRASVQKRKQSADLPKHVYIQKLKDAYSENEQLRQHIQMLESSEKQNCNSDQSVQLKLEETIRELTADRTQLCMAFNTSFEMLENIFEINAELRAKYCKGFERLRNFINWNPDDDSDEVKQEEMPTWQNHSKTDSYDQKSLLDNEILSDILEQPCPETPPLIRRNSNKTHFSDTIIRIVKTDKKSLLNTLRSPRFVQYTNNEKNQPPKLNKASSYLSLKEREAAKITKPNSIRIYKSPKSKLESNTSLSTATTTTTAMKDAKNKSCCNNFAEKLDKPIVRINRATLFRFNR